MCILIRCCVVRMRRKNDTKMSHKHNRRRCVKCISSVFETFKVGAKETICISESNGSAKSLN